MKTLLGLIQAVTDELGLDRPSIVIGSTDPQIRQLSALLNRLGSDIATQYEWEKLQREHVLNTVAVTTTGDSTAGSAVLTLASTAGITTQFGIGGPGAVPFAQVISVSPTQVTLNMPMLTTQTGATFQFSQTEYDLPSDWQREIPQTEWDRTNRWPLMGPTTAQDWQSFKSGIVYAGPRQRFRIMDGVMKINPLPPNDLLFAFEYMSSSWVRSSTGERQTEFLADTDTTIYSDSLLITGLKSQWKASKGLDATYDLSEFRGLLEAAKAQDKSAAKLSLSPMGSKVLLTTMNLPDGNWARE